MPASPTRPKKHARRHRGVALIKPDPERRIGWRARYRDPDSGKVVKETLAERDAHTVDSREDWAVKKARAIDRRTLELAEGATRATGTPLADAVDGFYRAHPRLREKTLEGYRIATAKLLRWAAKAGVRTTDELTRAKLLGLREQLINEPKRSAAKGGKRGAKVTAEGVQRSPFSVNRDLAGLRAVLGYLSERDLMARIHEGDLRRALKKLPISIERIEFLQSSELKQLFDAALLHDSATYLETRNEHAGRKLKGSTMRYEPIAPTVAIILLSGMRLGEALTLDWRQVDLDALGSDGNAVGEIQLTGATKTKRARTIDLAVSPALRALLLKMRGEGTKTGRVLSSTESGAKSTAERLRKDFGAPPTFTWQSLRRTCGTYLTNAPGIFGAASAYRSARQLGHSVAVAERHYLGLVRGIPKTATTLEAALGVEDETESVIASAALP